MVNIIMILCCAVWWIAPFIFLFGRLVGYWNTPDDKIIMVLLMCAAMLVKWRDETRFDEGGEVE